MNRHILKHALVVLSAAFLMTVLIGPDGSRSIFASSAAKQLSIVFSNDTLGYVEPCG